MDLTKILPIKKWCAIESYLFDVYHIQGSVFNTEGIRITDTKNWSNPLCPVIKSTDKGQSFICSVAHMNMAKQAVKSKSAVVDTCDAGLLKIVVPICFDGKYLGVIGGCGLLSEGGEVDAWAVNKLTGIDKTKVERLSKDIATISEDQINSACNYIQNQLTNIYDHYKNQLA